MPNPNQPVRPLLLNSHGNATPARAQQHRIAARAPLFRTATEPANFSPASDTAPHRRGRPQGSHAEEEGKGHRRRSSAHLRRTHGGGARSRRPAGRRTRTRPRLPRHRPPPPPKTSGAKRHSACLPPPPRTASRFCSARTHLPRSPVPTRARPRPKKSLAHPNPCTLSYVGALRHISRTEAE
jgi:hypothetical protein